MQDQNKKCDKENIIHQFLKVQAQIKVMPLVTHGEPSVTCLDSCIEPNGIYRECGYHNHPCAGPVRPWHGYNYTLTQIIRVEIPICIDADIDIKDGIVCCDVPEISGVPEDGNCESL